MSTKIQKKCKKIRLLVTDVDCVLTDGGMYYTGKGDVMKKFHTRDGMGVTLLRKHEIPTIIITKEKTPMVRNWAKKMKIKKIYDGIRTKENLLEKIIQVYNLKSNEIAYIGDDVNDINLMKLVGFSVSPKDGIPPARKTADYISNCKGGEGVLREVADLILSVKFPDKKNWY